MLACTSTAGYTKSNKKVLSTKIKLQMLFQFVTFSEVDNEQYFKFTCRCWYSFNLTVLMNPLASTSFEGLVVADKAAQCIVFAIPEIGYCGSGRAFSTKHKACFFIIAVWFCTLPGILYREWEVSSDPVEWLPIVDSRRRGGAYVCQATRAVFYGESSAHKHLSRLTIRKL